MVTLINAMVTLIHLLLMSNDGKMLEPSLGMDVLESLVPVYFSVLSWLLISFYCEKY